MSDVDHNMNMTLDTSFESPRIKAFKVSWDKVPEDEINNTYYYTSESMANLVARQEYGPDYPGTVETIYIETVDMS